jgi:hypothetical protein
MELGKYSLGIGDRFGLEGTAQLRALQKAEQLGVKITPVWNKSNREHMIIGTSPADTRRAAEDAVRVCEWNGPYFIDADHIGLATVDRFIEASDFFTIDVADYIGKPSTAISTASFLKAMSRFKGILTVPGIPAPLRIGNELLMDVAQKYLYAVEEAGKVYRHIAERKQSFVPEVSFDEATSPQTPAELFFILAAIALEGIPIRTIAVKFTGDFLKGVDYVGDVDTFRQEFEDDLAVVAFAVETFKLPEDLKLSVHTGSDKFSLYPSMHEAIKKFDAGLHLKTAGTTWLEEVIGLAASGGEGLKLVKELYAEAFKRYDELCKPYLTVIHVDKNQLPDPRQVEAWTAVEYVEALQHNQSCGRFNPHLRQFIHVAFKVAAEMGDRYRTLLHTCREVIESGVTTNIFERHIQPLFLGHLAAGEGEVQAPRRAARA